MSYVAIEAMNKYVVVIFPDEAKAYRGGEALEELDSDGSVTLCGMVIVRKDGDGNICATRTQGPPMRSTVIGGVIGALIGVLGGPIAVALGAGGGAWLGTWRDMSRLGIGADFFEHVSRELTPGRAAVVAEVHEDWIRPLDERMEELDGVVVREWRTDFVEAGLVQEAFARKAEVAQLLAERAEAGGDGRGRLDARLDEAKAKARELYDRAANLLESLDEDTDAVVAVMQLQAEKAAGDKQARIEQRIAETRAAHARRAGLLKQAQDLAMEAQA